MISWLLWLLDLTAWVLPRCYFFGFHFLRSPEEQGVKNKIKTWHVFYKLCRHLPQTPSTLWTTAAPIAEVTGKAPTDFRDLWTQSISRDALASVTEKPFWWKGSHWLQERLGHSLAMDSCDGGAPFITPLLLDALQANKAASALYHPLPDSRGRRGTSFSSLWGGSGFSAHGWAPVIFLEGLQQLPSISFFHLCSTTRSVVRNFFWMGKVSCLRPSTEMWNGFGSNFFFCCFLLEFYLKKKKNSTLSNSWSMENFIPKGGCFVKLWACKNRWLNWNGFTDLSTEGATKNLL